MNRTTIISLIVVVLVCLVGAGLWCSRPQEGPPPAPVQPKKTEAERPAPAPPSPPVAEAPEPPKPEPVEVATAQPAEAEEEAVEEPPQPEVTPDDPFGGKPITVETLTGCKQVQQMSGGELIFEFAPDGEWKVNGNPRAKWTIVGNRVKIYRDDTDEVHYVDIVGNKLVHNGKELEITR